MLLKFITAWIYIEWSYALLYANILQKWKVFLHESYNSVQEVLGLHISSMNLETDD